jgi:hypothetical protein
MVGTFLALKSRLRSFSFVKVHHTGHPVQSRSNLTAQVKENLLAVENKFDRVWCNLAHCLHLPKLCRLLPELFRHFIGMILALIHQIAAKFPPDVSVIFLTVFLRSFVYIV